MSRRAEAGCSKFFPLKIGAFDAPRASIKPVRLTLLFAQPLFYYLSDKYWARIFTFTGLHSRYTKSAEASNVALPHLSCQRLLVSLRRP